MKKLYALLLSLTVLTAARSQTQLPNSGFESWVTVEGQLDPEGYYTSDSADFPIYTPLEAVTQSNDAHTGKSVKIAVVPNGLGGMLVGV